MRYAFASVIGFGFFAALVFGMATIAPPYKPAHARTCYTNCWGDQNQYCTTNCY